jgi:predicted anti-sigma-YlaC factor YlaD
VRTDCEQARQRVSLQLDGELSPHETLLLERHLGGCSACEAFASGVRASTGLLRSTPLEPTPHFWLVRRRPAATRLTARVAAVTAAAAAAVLVAVSTGPLVSSSQTTSAGLVGIWPTGLAVHTNGDENLGVQRVAYEGRPNDGPRRGVKRGQFAT